MYNICKIIDLYNNNERKNNNYIYNQTDYILNNISFVDEKFELEKNISFDIINNNKNTISYNGYNFSKVLNISNRFKNKKNIFKVITKKCRYKGVTKNKKKFQVYIRFKNKNTYLGSYSCEKTAAKIYDIMLIKKRGIKAKTNFKYSMRIINKILKSSINIEKIFKILSKYKI